MWNVWCVIKGMCVGMLLGSGVAAISWKMATIGCSAGEYMQDWYMVVSVILLLVGGMGSAIAGIAVCNSSWDEEETLY